MAIALDEKPIMMIGAERSGTTLVMCLVGAHPRISVPEVGWLYPRFYPYLHTYGDLSIEENLKTLASEMLFGLNQPFWGMDMNPTTAVDEILSEVREQSFAGIYCAMHERFTKDTGKPRWGQKTPHNLYFVKQIKEDIPNAKFVFITRDGRDASAECLQASFGHETIYCAAKSWMHCQNAAKPWRESLDKSDWFDVKYEELVRNPEQILRELCDFLEEDYAPEMLDFYQGGIAAKRGKTKDNAPLGHAISDKYVGIYKRLLSVQEQEIFAAVAGNELEESGYTSDVPPCEISPNDERLWVERDGRLRAALLDFHGGHIVYESYRDWLADQRVEREKKGVWKAADAKSLFPPEDENHIVGMRAPKHWKEYFSIKRRFTPTEGVQ